MPSAESDGLPWESVLPFTPPSEVEARLRSRATAQNPGTQRSAGCGCPAAARRATPPYPRSAATFLRGSTAACSCRSRRGRQSRPPRRSANDTSSSTSRAPKRWLIWSDIRSIWRSIPGSCHSGMVRQHQTRNLDIRFDASHRPGMTTSIGATNSPLHIPWRRWRRRRDVGDRPLAREVAAHVGGGVAVDRRHRSDEREEVGDLALGVPACTGHDDGERLVSR